MRTPVGALAHRRLLRQVLRAASPDNPERKRQAEGQDPDQVVRRGPLGLQEGRGRCAGAVKNPTHFVRVRVHGGQRRA